jgi:hypothetical protein
LDAAHAFVTLNIARTNEAKALGIKMGAPWFQIRHLEDEAGLVCWRRLNLDCQFSVGGNILGPALLGSLFPLCS